MHVLIIHSQICQHWVRQCFWNFLDWPEVCLYLTTCTLLGADYQVCRWEALWWGIAWISEPGEYHRSVWYLAILPTGIYSYANVQREIPSKLAPCLIYKESWPVSYFLFFWWNYASGNISMQNQDTVTHYPVLPTQQAMGCKILLLYFLLILLIMDGREGGEGER